MNLGMQEILIIALIISVGVSGVAWWLFRYKKLI